VCNKHVHNAAKRKKHINPAALDPTRTSTIRHRFLVVMRAKFKRLQRDVIDLVDKQDAFGLKAPAGSPFVQNRAAFQFLTTDEKLKGFNKWFKQRVDEGVLETTGDADPSEPWTGKYVDSAYRKGTVNSYIAARPNLRNTPSDYAAGSQAEFLRSAFAQPEAVAKLRLLGTRSFEALKGITTDMSSKLSTVLADGLAHGKNPREIARNLAKTIEGISVKRAQTLARTEVINAHSEGQLDAFEELGVEEVGILAEWATAGDNRVCPLCNDLSGVVMTIKEARGLIPRHPNCRCAWLPAFADEKAKGQRRTAPTITAAVTKSARKEQPRARDPRKASRWAGAKKDYRGKPVRKQPARS
jgi:SPP1 gp7 family putative phage head morphogenesis protein